jgi:DNA-binding MarR family transcriptional regulator
LHIISARMNISIPQIIRQPKQEELISGFLLEKTAKLMKLHFSRILAAHPEIDITIDQWIILDLLFNQGPINQQNLAEMSMKDAPTVTRILDILENKQYIHRQLDANDRRKFNISLLEKGREMHELVWPLAQSFRAECYNNLSAEELRTFSSVLVKIQLQFNQLQ